MLVIPVGERTSSVVLGEKFAGEHSRMRSLERIQCVPDGLFDSRIKSNFPTKVEDKKLEACKCEELVRFFKGSSRKSVERGLDF